MQTKVKGTRVRYNKESALKRYRLFCHKNYLDEKPIKEVKFNTEQNMVRLFGYDRQLVHAFMPEMVVDGNHKLEVGYITHNRSTIPYNASK